MKDPTGVDINDVERITLWIDKRTKRKAKMRAAADDTTVSLMVEKLLNEHLKANGKSK